MFLSGGPQFDDDVWLLSSKRRVDKGCPQGLVLGPVLWNIVLEGLLRIELPEDFEVLAFADDTVLLAHGDSRLAYKLQ